ncbi:hypothetical protein H4R18_004970 [Coemansia javaensis]|uniref:MRN complex-interacting protein N-terminal domain-containing protein n=1 Tax=Coemansia javaensis TaxID=2761396 RepID=A0A9W8LG42_9FUNG|nr:hypothetical protein H4R18_004970 [Coemansia javaensis]
MPNYQVVRCASDGCAKFQSQQEKKSGKWACVVCGLKQSLRRVYLQSSVAKECRAAVMELNMSRGQAAAAAAAAASAAAARAQSHRPHADTGHSDICYATDQGEAGPLAASRWDEYAEKTQQSASDAEAELDQHNRIVVGRLAEQDAGPAKRAQRRPQPAKGASSTQTRPKPYDRAPPPALPAERPTLAQALAGLAKRQQPPKEAPAPREPAIAAAATAQEQDGPSRWDCYASDSDADSE